MNYYFSPYNRAKAELYINDFKKDIVKIFQSYYFKPSSIFFDLYNKAYENILLNVENIELFSNILQTLFSKDNLNSKFIIKIKDSLLPIILNYLTMFGSINSKSFIKFKIDNIKLINKIYDILNKVLENNKNNTLLDNNLTENISNTLKHINKYKIIYEDINKDLNKLNDYDFNTEYYKFGENEDTKDKVSNEKNDEKSKKLKEKYKDLMKNKQDNFIEKIQENNDMNNAIQKEEKNQKLEINDKDDMICCTCRNKIDINSYEEPYAKLCMIHNGYFNKSCLSASINSELNKIIKKNIEEKKNIYSNILKNDKQKDLSPRLISCGHYFHEKCYKEGLNNGFFKCPICEEYGNLLIPPMINLYEKNPYLKSEKLNSILDKKKEFKKIEFTQENNNLKDINVKFIKSNILKDLNLDDKENILDYNSIIDKLFLCYETSLNYLGNLFYWEVNTFYKYQQIDNIHNFILSLRYLTKINYIDINQIINYIRNGIDILIKGPNENENIIEKYKEMYYSKYIDKIIFTFLILLDYDEIKKLFLYIINITLPYFSFWIYFRNLIGENNFYSLYNEEIKKKINFENFKQFLNDNIKQMNDYLKMFLQKLLIIKLISKYDNKKEDINNSNINKINELSIEQIFNELNIENLYKILSINNEKEINFIDLLEKSIKILSSDNSFLTQDCVISDYSSVLNLLINNIKNKKEEKYLMNAEFFSQFILYKFELTKNLDENLFDWIEKNIFKKCVECNKESFKNFICLFCGEKICNNKECLFKHINSCMKDLNMFIDAQTMRLYCVKKFYIIYDKDLIEEKIVFKTFYPLYTNSNGDCPDMKIFNEFKLNNEKINTAVRDFLCFNFK